MIVITRPASFEYVASSGDWRLLIGDGHFDIYPQVGLFEYTSGTNLDNLAKLITEAKTHAVANGINWSGQ